ncbi:hypothetical protein [Undibacterium squillarum]
MEKISKQACKPGFKELAVQRVTSVRRLLDIHSMDGLLCHHDIR